MLQELVKSSHGKTAKDLAHVVGLATAKSFGPIMAAIPAIAVAAIQEPLLGLLVAGIFVLVQQIENHLIYPLVVRKTVGVPPLLAIIALLIGGKLAGIMGFIVAVPVAVVFVEYFNDVAAHKKTFL